ncbi:MAG: DNA polymerase III, subunit gamma and tau [Elusimicrobia bacterium RIFOXYC2_FULL_34_12]|nr:MAG: DNA polymerase III, subunit gamma and tau [Elusimicrobia bacterium RIFOXYC2_FULL_34_12]OGS37942.1 MAG: DNA polymerase III, subunit gamma and tau [Elusimicrobia bacterium RIFOXYD2_FULL_34_30]HAM39252.1 hypothetical protein [Elusimicrobiota bacterium]
MSYIVLARKHRPQKFGEIIGQEHITRVLKNAIKENRVAHGYIFSGQRGIGKTTTARIFAKALNCKELSKEEPCNKCTNCEEITKGNSLDVIEIDGASNRGIEEIRELRENIKYAPSMAKYKIYIIDEAHQITDPAWNALLKTLEEPPAHAVFIFATTSTQKIPATILSRCQRFSFRPLSIKEISEHLLETAKKEKIKIDEMAVKLISHSSGGALRDALSIFDQVISFCGTDITSKDVISILGIVKEDTLSKMVECIYESDSKQILKTVGDTIASGYDPLNIVSDLQEYIRNIMLYKVSPESISMISDIEKLKTFSNHFTTDALLRLIDLLSDCLYQMKNAEQPILVLEVQCFKLTQKYIGLDELVTRLEQIEGTSPFNEIPKPEKIDKIGTEPNISSIETLKTASISETKLVQANISIEKVRAAWNELSKSNDIKPRIVAAVLNSRIIAQNNGIFQIEFNSSFNMDLIKSSKSIWLPIIEKQLGSKFNYETKLKIGDKIEDTEIEEEADIPDVHIETEQSIIIEEKPTDEKTVSLPTIDIPKKKKMSKEEIFEKEPIAKTIVDLFDGKIVEE